jgi:hypothetical protein
MGGLPLDMATDRMHGQMVSVGNNQLRRGARYIGRIVRPVHFYKSHWGHTAVHKARCFLLLEYRMDECPCKKRRDEEVEEDSEGINSLFY